MEEIWKKHPYLDLLVSNLGNIKSMDIEREYIRNGKICKRKFVSRLLKQFKDKDGYLRVQGYKSVARLVCQTFLENLKNNPIVNHINGIKNDNRLDNLEWCTRRENDLHAFRLGLRNHKKQNHPQFAKYHIKDIITNKKKISGVNNPKSKINEHDVLWIRSNIGILTQKEMSDKLGISQVMVSRVILRKNWNYF